MSHATETREAEADQSVVKCARDRGFVSEEQLSECLDVQALAGRHFARHVPLAEVLFLRGLVDVDQLHALFDAAGKRPAAPTQLGSRALFGKIAVESGFISPEHVLRCLDLQREEVKQGKPPRPLGAILMSEGYLTQEQLEEILRLQKAAAAAERA